MEFGAVGGSPLVLTDSWGQAVARSHTYDEALLSIEISVSVGCLELLADSHTGAPEALLTM